MRRANSWAKFAGTVIFLGSCNFLLYTRPKVRPFLGPVCDIDNCLKLF